MEAQAKGPLVPRSRGFLGAALAFTVMVWLLMIGCGSGGDSSSPPPDGPIGGAAQFLQPGSANNKLVEFGEEAPADIRAEASEVLDSNLTAREAADFTTQCATLAKKQAEQISHVKGTIDIAACAKELRKLAEPLSGSKSIRANQLTGQIAALRLKGDQAFALFQGKDTKSYAMPMRKEGPEWKVGAILMTELGKG